ncbi:Crp/Fnr family transcriptional regulator [Terasakiella pusilla]|uniref:Crp/Fnr family transcriptional regulator n=1 Tax=Terasakiella pusilla TaxID=64973 RepID=UPI003AA9CB08
MSLERLATLPLLKRLTPERQETVYKSAQINKLQSGSVICKETTNVKRILWVLSGRLKTFVTLHDEEVVIDLLSKGDRLGFVEACAGLPHSVSAIAIEETEILSLDLEVFQRLTAEYFDFQLAVFANISAEMHGAVKEINELKAKNTSKRLGTFLLGLSGADQGTVDLELPYDKRLLAARLGMKPESLSRAFGKLKACGVITQKNRITIGDVEMLRDFCGDEYE